MPLLLHARALTAEETCSIPVRVVVVICAILYGAFVKRIGKRYQAMLAEASTIAHEKIGCVRYRQRDSNCGL